jgi:two-component system response regulator FlrC
VDVRIIATSNRNLRKAVSDGIFREDLFYRLSVIPIEIPKLSERPLDIIPLAIFFCKKYSHSQKKLSAKMLHVIKNHKWSGNIRELENFVHRAVLFSSEKIIDVDSIQMNTLIHDSSVDSQQENNVIFMKDPELHDESHKTLAQIEKEVILNALEKFNGDKNLVSKTLDIPIRTLRYKLNSYKASEQFPIKNVI